MLEKAQQSNLQEENEVRSKTNKTSKARLRLSITWKVGSLKVDQKSADDFKSIGKWNLVIQVPAGSGDQKEAGSGPEEKAVSWLQVSALPPGNPGRLASYLQVICRMGEWDSVISQTSPISSFLGILYSNPVSREGGDYDSVEQG